MVKQIKKDEVLKKEVAEELKGVEEVVVEKPKPFSMQGKIGGFRGPAFLQDNTFNRKGNNRGGSQAPKRAAGRGR